jgi:RHS repeat-associated protein
VAWPSPAFAQSETVEYYGLDALGSVRAIFDQQGNLVGRMDYGPFGENLRAAIKFPTEQFAQLARDAESGQDYARERNYSAGTGRFSRVDPIFSTLFDTQQWNRYSYGRSDPLAFIDPSGAVIISPLCEGVCWDQGEAEAVMQVRLDSFLLRFRPKGRRDPDPRRKRERPNPPNGPTDEPPPWVPPAEGNDCRVLSNGLAALAARLPPDVSTVNRAGKDLVGFAFQAPFNRNPGLPTGFDPMLVQPGNQGWATHQHILAAAGTVMGSPGGLLLLGGATMYDTIQMAHGHSQGIAEVLGDIKGARVGLVMWEAVIGQWEPATTSARIQSIICK